ncbi:MAG: hypothetical protein JWN30_234, partial [Bacilli bacterium]|nr:hypothetical protein [Bacilli bacterium]
LETDFYEEDNETDDYVAQDLEDDLEELGYVEMHCPNCNETVYVDQDFFADDDIVEVLCPECNETILVNDDAPALTALDGE